MKFVTRAALVMTLMIAAVVCMGCSDSARWLLDSIIGGDSNGEVTGDGPSARLANTPVDDRLVTGNTRFAFDMYGRLARPTENTFVCPASISLALSMTYNGAAGTTASEMQNVLGFSGMDRDEVNSASQILLSNLIYGDEQVRLDIANSLWPREGTVFNDAFITRNRQYFGAEVNPIDMLNPASVGIINNWVSNNTHGKIEQVLDAIPSDAALYLINAIYFKGTWTYEFDPDDTRDGQFTCGDGSTVTVPMMELESGYNDGNDKRLRHMQTDDFQAVSLPYGDDGRFSMYVFLPHSTTGLEAFMADLTEENWNTWLESFQPAEGTVYLPRFSLEWDAELQDTLAVMGMPSAFSGSADFSDMFPPDSPQRVFISRVIHKTILEVNEEGTEAAGVTVVEMRFTSVGGGRFTMRMDHPFFLAIVDNTTGTILFMGNVSDPS